MLFFEYTFLFVFLPVTIAVDRLLARRRRNAWLFLASCVFYAASSLMFLPVLVTSVLVDFYAGRRIAGATSQTDRRLYLYLSLVVNLGLLAFFKYIGLITATLRAIFGDDIPLIEAALPVGISFYTFQSMSYTIDLYRGTVQPVRSFSDFGAYVTMFPQLIAGPIVRYAEIDDQLRERSTSENRFASGVFMLAVGLGKKLLVADTLAVLSAHWFAGDNPGFVGAWASMLMFAGQIYFDFSGYSDMAIGLGRMVGFELPVNFDSPYQATGFSDFWRRWHISLSKWLRDYLYVPLGGNRKGPRRTYLNLMVTMLLGGLWHGASWNFLLWGLAHGALLAGERLLRERKPLALPVTAKRLLVFLTVTVVWVPFKFERFERTLTWLEAMFLGRGGWGSLSLVEGLALLAFAALIWIPKSTSHWRIRFSVPQVVFAIGVFAASILVGYGRVESSPFLYFRF